MPAFHADADALSASWSQAVAIARLTRERDEALARVEHLKNERLYATIRETSMVERAKLIRSVRFGVRYVNRWGTEVASLLGLTISFSDSDGDG